MPLSVSSSPGSQLSLAPGPLSDPEHARVLDYTRQVFGSAATLSRELDPETGEECWVVVAPAAGQVDSIVAANDQWHRGMLDVAGEFAHRYRLSLDPQ